MSPALADHRGPLLQVDPSSTGRIGAGEAALFLKRSGLSDAVLGKVCATRSPLGFQGPGGGVSLGRC